MSSPIATAWTPMPAGSPGGGVAGQLFAPLAADRADFPLCTELAAACDEWCEHINARTHRETGAKPVDRLALERARLHPLPAEPHVMALGEERLVNEDQTVRFGSVRHSTQPGHVDSRVWCWVVGEEQVIVALTKQGTREIARHLLSTPGNPRILDAHYPHHPGGNHPRPPRPRPRSKAEADFLDIGEGAHTWLVEAAATGATRVRAKMARAVEFATILGAETVDHALGVERHRRATAATVATSCSCAAAQAAKRAVLACP